jgi:hypothetical protein
VDIAAWLRELGLERCAQVFQDSEIEPKTLAELSDEDFKELGIPLGLRRKLVKAMATLAAEALHGEQLTPLVGRKQELGILLQRWTWAKDGDGQVVLLAGEPGIGKSRIIQSVRELVRDDSPTVLCYFCSPFYVHSPLHPVLEQLKRAAQLNKGDSPEVKLDKLEALLSLATARTARAAALLAPLLSIPTGERYPPLDITPERKKTLVLEALLEQLAGLASRPVLMMLEDAHWDRPPPPPSCSI